MSYIGTAPTIGNFQVCDAISVVNGQASYTMQVSGVNATPQSANHMLVSLNGILQKPNSSFTVSGSTITFASNLVTGDVIDFIQILGDVLDLGVPSDNTVSASKLTNDIISGQTELATSPATTDEILISDAGTLKRIDYNLITPRNIIQTVVSGTQAVGSTSLTDLTNATLNITPASTSSKILILGRIQADIGNNGFGYAIFRDSTKIFETTAGYDVYNDTGNARAVNTVCFLDSPSSTSEITYKYQVKTYDTDNVTFQNAGQSIITALEV